MADPQDTADPMGAVALFPLPNVVLFPRAVLPLHIFEERYKMMTAHALEGDRQIAMALLKAGWEKNYYHKPEIEPVVCVGTILTHERLADGKYNFLLQGTTRARVLRELGNEPYRLAELEPLRETNAMEIDLEEERQRLTSLFGRAPLASTRAARQFRELLEGPLTTADIADLVAFNFLEDVELKQSLLGDADVKRRVRRTIEALERKQPALHLSANFRMPHDPSVN